MKQFLLAVSVSMVAVAGLQAQKKTSGLKVVNPAGVIPKQNNPLRNTNDSFSYALGLNIANNLKQQGIDNISAVAMQKGLNDVFNKKPSLLTDKQANACIQQTIQANMGKRNEIQKARETEMLAEAQKTKEAGAAFLAENKKRTGIVTLPDGLQYEVLKQGDASSPMPKVQDTFVVHYSGKLINGQEFDNSYERHEPLSLPMSNVIPGWTEILQKMHVGDKYKVYIPSELGYGDRSMGADIPGGSTLVFEMELLGIKPGQPAETPKQN